MKILFKIQPRYYFDEMTFNLQDVEFLMQTLPNVVTAKKIEIEKFEHMEFLFSTRAKIMIYEKILEEDKSYLEETLK